MHEIDEIFKNKINEECGVFAIYQHDDAAEITYYALHALQHRGQEGCGIVTTNGENFKKHKGEGLVTKVFKENHLKELKGVHAIGHVRYSNASGSGIQNVQPFNFVHHTGNFALAHNGNIVNSQDLREMLEDRGSIFQSSSDTEILAHLLKQNKRQSTFEALERSLRMLDGAFTFVILFKDEIYACRDKNGLRPLSLGRIGESYVITSETCCFEVIGATWERDIQPGEMVRIHQNGIESKFYANEVQQKLCAMEYIYFARPDSDLDGVNVHYARKNSGIVLAKEAPVQADLVIGVPDSSISAAIGYAEASGIPYEMGLIKNKYIARTFIQPTQELREKGVKMKLSAVKSLVKGKDVVLIDDSIVRGTTSKRIVHQLKEAGANQVHVRIASPEMTHPCFYGVDTTTYDQLISARMSTEELRQFIDADSLVFISQKGMFEAFKRSEMCTACFDGKYPTHTYKALEDANKDGKF